MSEPVIRVRGLGKQYRIGGAAKPYRTLRESVTDSFASPFRRLAGKKGAGRSSRSTSFWALQDVSFDVMAGEVVGIIGRNGAGKSTLLKVLSRIVDPTEGEVELEGRVGSLLEVGTGFHPELTGRENVFLNGAILGMTRGEIAKKFDEIVAFAETEKFLDTPVKFYSSGMYTRLAFAVAAHLEPEILVVDEVLAVGDLEFQKKCMGKMGDVAKQGRTVLFVSHNVGAIAALCTKSVLLKSGRVVETGPTDQVLNTYVSQGYSAEGEVHFDRPAVPGAIAWISRAATVDDNGATKNQFMMGETLNVEMDIVVPEQLNRMAVSMEIKTDQGVGVLHLVGNDNGYYAMRFQGKHRVRMSLPELPIYPGKYMLWVWVGDPRGNDYDYRRDCLSFEVANGELLPRAGIHRAQALIHLRSNWAELPLPAGVT